MERKISKQVKMSRELADRITKVARSEASSFSQFMRTAAIQALNARNVNNRKSAA